MGSHLFGGKDYDPFVLDPTARVPASTRAIGSVQVGTSGEASDRANPD